MDQDWNPVVLRKKPTATSKDEKVAKARREGGEVETVKKFDGGGNKQRGGPVAPAYKLEDAEAEVKVEHVELSLSRAIQQARQAKGWSQKELAVQINEKSQVINEYESGRAIPDPKIISKLERALNTRLPRSKPKPKPDLSE